MATKDSAKEENAADFYQRAKKAMDNYNYEKAIEIYEQLEARYPYGNEVRQGQLDIIYAYYRHHEPELAISSAKRFIQLYPSHDKVDYAHYLLGLVSYKQGQRMMDEYQFTDPSQRDTKILRESYQYFSALIQRYPDSPYVKDAANIRLELRNTLARHEINIAAFYFAREAYVAANNRAKYVMENYPRTPSIPKALDLLVKTYEKMKLPQLAESSRRLLELNYPNYPSF
jgi:outer membrane protein assembly factor BamD